jgi:hypothetical protein
MVLRRGSLGLVWAQELHYAFEAEVHLLKARHADRIRSGVAVSVSYKVRTILMGISARILRCAKEHPNLNNIKGHFS